MVSSHRYPYYGMDMYTIHVNFFLMKNKKKLVDIRVNEFWEGHMEWGLSTNYFGELPWWSSG